MFFFSLWPVPLGTSSQGYGRRIYNFKILHKFSNGFKPGDWLGHAFKTFLSYLGCMFGVIVLLQTSIFSSHSVSCPMRLNSPLVCPGTKCAWSFWDNTHNSSPIIHVELNSCQRVYSYQNILNILSEKCFV